MKTGIIDVGGGFRDIYGAGVLDVCMAQNIHFDYCIGISAGSANLISYMALQPKRNYTFYMESDEFKQRCNRQYSTQTAYMISVRRFGSLPASFFPCCHPAPLSFHLSMDTLAFD